MLNSIRHRLAGRILGPLSRASRIVADHQACIAMPPRLIADTYALRSLRQPSLEPTETVHRASFH